MIGCRAFGCDVGSHGAGAAVEVRGPGGSVDPLNRSSSGLEEGPPPQNLWVLKAHMMVCTDLIESFVPSQALGCLFWLVFGRVSFFIGPPVASILAVKSWGMINLSLQVSGRGKAKALL